MDHKEALLEVIRLRGLVRELEADIADVKAQLEKIKRKGRKPMSEETKAKISAKLKGKTPKVVMEVKDRKVRQPTSVDEVDPFAWLEE